MVVLIKYSHILISFWCITKCVLVTQLTHTSQCMYVCGATVGSQYLASAVYTWGHIIVCHLLAHQQFLTTYSWRKA